MINIKEIFELDEPSILVPTPCGCIIDSSTKVQDGIVLCPWCDATFSLGDFDEWVHGDAPPLIFLSNGPKSMIRCDEGHVHEVYCEQDGLPVVQKGKMFFSFTSFEWVLN